MSGMADAVSETDSSTAGPCLTCGACCGTFRVSFYWAEAETRGLPETLTEKLNPWLSCMAGTNAVKPHGGALEGEIGQQVNCRVYAARPSPCREVEPGDERCSRARACHGLPPAGDLFVPSARGSSGPAGSGDRRHADGGVSVSRVVDAFKTKPEEAKEA